MSANNPTAIDGREQPDFRNNIVRITAWAESVFARRRTRRILEELDDHMLNDIGISRSDIPRVAGLA
jgi:uncharacterized protein YjiS (DUF1127 family)